MIFKRKMISSKVIISIISILCYLILFAGILQYLNLIFPNDFGFYKEQYIKCENNSTFINEMEINRTHFSSEINCNDGIFFTDTNIRFDTAIYFLVVTIMTVGYGDIYPITLLSKIFIASSLIFLIIIISVHSREISESLVDIMIHQKPYKSLEKGKHIILTGFINISNLNNFLSLKYHSSFNCLFF